MFLFFNVVVDIYHVQFFCNSSHRWSSFIRIFTIKVRIKPFLLFDNSCKLKKRFDCTKWFRSSSSGYVDKRFINRKMERYYELTQTFTYYSQYPRCRSSLNDLRLMNRWKKVRDLEKYHLKGLKRQIYFGLNAFKIQAWFSFFIICDLWKYEPSVRGFHFSRPN